MRLRLNLHQTLDVCDPHAPTTLPIRGKRIIFAIGISPSSSAVLSSVCQGLRPWLFFVGARPVSIKQAPVNECEWLIQAKRFTKVKDQEYCTSFLLELWRIDTSCLPRYHFSELSFRTSTDDAT